MSGSAAALRVYGMSRAQFMGGTIRAVLLLLMLGCWFGLPQAHALPNALRSVEYAALPGNSVQISLVLEAPLAAPQVFVTENPARIIMDLTDAANGLTKKTQQIGIGAVQSVTAVEAGGRTRVVVNLSNPVEHNVATEGNTIKLTVQGQGQVPMANKGGPSTKPASMTSQGGSTALAKQAGITDIDFRRGPGGEGRVVVALSDPKTIFDIREEGAKVVVEFMGAKLPDKLVQHLDVADFATPVKSIETRPDRKNIRMEISAIGDYQHMAYQANDTLTVEFRPLTKAEKEAARKEKQVFTGDRLSLNFQDIDVRAVLQLLADFTGMNLVTSDTVKGNVTLRLKNVPWDQALDIILKTKGLSMRQNGNVMLVAPTEEIAAREKLELEAQQQIEELAPLRSQYIQINYGKAEKLAELLKKEDNPMLTPGRGSVSFDDRTNTLLVQDTAAKLEDIRRLVEVLDKPVRQVLIESRVVIATNDFSKDLGVRFGFNRGNSWHDGHYAVIGGGRPGTHSGTADLAPGFESPEGSGAEALMVNLPYEGDRGGAFNFVVGKIGSWMLQLELSAMQKEGKGEIISSPRLITADQNEAIIEQGQEIPYTTVSNNGTNVQFKKAVLSLKAKPHITPDDRVIMDLTVTKDQPDYSRSVLGQPPIDTRKETTTLLVDNGDTVVLGGVFEANRTLNTEKVPFFGDLPYLGALFKNKSQTSGERELLIFVTPRILKDGLAVR